MTSHFEPYLVVLSLLVALLASYTALDLSGRIALLSGLRSRRLWLVGGAVAMGCGVWSMHFIGMLAFTLPIQMGYDPVITGASLVLAILVSYFALRVAVAPHLGWKSLIASAVLMAGGIAGMHYSGMVAMRMQPAIQYRTGLLLASLLIAFVASLAALSMARALCRSDVVNLARKRLLAALCMAIGISGMHYVGMYAAIFPVGAICGSAQGINASWLGGLVSLVVVAMSVVALLTSRFDTRHQALAGALSQLNEQIGMAGKVDLLTDLPNRGVLLERLTLAVVEAAAASSQLAVLFIDLDGFKSVNDLAGHAAGDQLLRSFAHRLQGQLPPDAMVARIGGDEFVLLFEGLDSPRQVTGWVESMLSPIRQDGGLDGFGCNVMPSVGIALFPSDGTDADTLIRKADAAMYVAKRSGRGQYRFYEEGMQDSERRLDRIRAGVMQALAGDQLELTFYPQFDAMGAKVLGAVAIPQYADSVLGRINSEEWLPMAERSGQGKELGDWLLRKTCRQVRLLSEAGVPLVKVSVPLTPAQWLHPQLEERVLAIVMSEQLQTQHIMFEVPESLMMEDPVRSVQRVQSLQRAGFAIAISGFGIGRSSLAFLPRLGASQLKIDRLLIQELATDTRQGAVVTEAIITLAHSLKMTVVAEGVETMVQLNLLRALGCDAVQGPFSGRPVNLMDLGVLLEPLGSGLTLVK
ncbi:putative bifunctional diguanylate cyclase/phosphodiesterase [Frateuria aurantia]